MATLEQLRREHILQAHHWQAARWFSELPSSCAARKFIYDELCIIAANGNRATVKLNIDPGKLLESACVLRETIQPNEHVIGVLRESLNAVSRAMRLERMLN